MKVLYVAGPYRAKTLRGIHENIEAAKTVALRYWQSGWAVICPHANTAFMDGACPDDVWLKGDLEIIARCDAVVMMPRWKESAGATAEHEHAKALGKKILYEM